MSNIIDLLTFIRLKTTFVIDFIHLIARVEKGPLGVNDILVNHNTC